MLFLVKIQQIVYRLHLYIVHNHIFSFAKARKNASFKRHIFLEVMLCHTSYLHRICLNTSYTPTKKPFVFIFSVYGVTAIYTKKGKIYTFRAPISSRIQSPHTWFFSGSTPKNLSYTLQKTVCEYHMYIRR